MSKILYNLQRITRDLRMECVVCLMRIISKVCETLGPTSGIKNQGESFDVHRNSKLWKL